MPTITLTVNGKPVTAEVPANMLLVQFLRERLDLTGTHVGCDTSQCGACTVHLDGRSAKSCTTLAAQCDGASVTTIEGMAAPGGAMHPLQRAFNQTHGLQCGYCTPGMVMSLSDLLQQNPNPSEDDVRHWLEGNLCRCTGYTGIVRATLLAAEWMRGAGAQPAMAAE